MTAIEKLELFLRKHRNFFFSADCSRGDVDAAMEYRTPLHGGGYVESYVSVELKENIESAIIELLEKANKVAERNPHEVSHHRPGRAAG